jgi:hypothetical protein
MRKILLAVLSGCAFAASVQAQTASRVYTGPDSVEVKLSIQVLNGKNGVPLGRPGAQAWDVGPGRIPLPDIALCVSAPGMERWCTPGFAPGAGAVPLCRDSVTCEASLRMPKSAPFFDIIIKDIDLQVPRRHRAGQMQHDDGPLPCR